MLKKVESIELIEVTEVEDKRVGVALFRAKSKPEFVRAEFLETMATRGILVRSLTRSDLPIRRQLRTRLASAEAVDANTLTLLARKEVEPVLTALAYLRNFATELRAKKSRFALTPRAADLLLLLERHLALLRKRGVELPDTRGTEHAAIVRAQKAMPRSGETHKRWRGDSKRLTAAARLLETAFLREYVTELKAVSAQALVVVDRTIGMKDERKVRVRREHGALATAAADLAALLDRSLRGFRFDR